MEIDRLVKSTSFTNCPDCNSTGWNLIKNVSYFNNSISTFYVQCKECGCFYDFVVVYETIKESRV